MPKSVLDFDPIGTVAGTDVLYAIKGTGLDRDRRMTAAEFSAWLGTQLAPREFKVTGTGVVTIDISGIPFALVHTTPGVTGLILDGTVLQGAQIIVVNGSAAPVTIAPDGFNLFTNALAEGNSVGSPYTLFNDGDAAVIFKVATAPGWQTFRVLAEKGLDIALAKLGLPLGAEAVGSTSSGSIPVVPLTQSTVGHLRNAGFVDISPFNLIGTPPKKFTISSAGTDKTVGVDSLSTIVAWSGTAGGAATSHTAAGGRFVVSGRLIEVVWDGITLFVTTLLV